MTRNNLITIRSLWLTSKSKASLPRVQYIYSRKMYMHMDNIDDGAETDVSDPRSDHYSLETCGHTHTHTLIDPIRKILDFPYNCLRYILFHAALTNWNIHSFSGGGQHSLNTRNRQLLARTYHDRRSCQTDSCRAGNSASNSSTGDSGTDAGTR